MSGMSHLKSLRPLFRHLARRQGEGTLAGVRCWTCRSIHASPAVLGITKLPAGRLTIPEAREQVEVSTTEWPFVERLFFPQAIPKPTATPGELKPSGWVAPSAKPGDYPYFVPRNISHMVPVYLTHKPIISKYRTMVHHVEGDIFQLAEEIKAYITQEREPKILNMRVHEPHQKIEIKGNYVGEVRQFLISKGF